MYHVMFIYNDGSPGPLYWAAEYSQCVNYIGLKVGRELTELEYDNGQVEHGDGAYWIIQEEAPLEISS